MKKVSFLLFLLFSLQLHPLQKKTIVQWGQKKLETVKRMWFCFRDPQKCTPQEVAKAHKWVIGIPVAALLAALASAGIYPKIQDFHTIQLQKKEAREREQRIQALLKGKTEEEAQELLITDRIREEFAKPFQNTETITALFIRLADNTQKKFLDTLSGPQQQLIKKGLNEESSRLANKIERHRLLKNIIDEILQNVEKFLLAK